MAANVKKPLHAINETKKNAAKTKQKNKHNKVVGGKPICFTLKEDQIILEIFQKKGVEAIDYKSLLTRVRRLQRSTGVEEKRKNFTLVQPLKPWSFLGLTYIGP